MARIEIYEPADCATGICNPIIEVELNRMQRIVSDLRGRGVEVLRYNIMEDGQAFLKCSAVKEALVESEGTDCLPLVLVDGKIVSREEYPSDLELAKWGGLPWSDLEIYSEREKREKTILFSPNGGGCDSCG